VCRIASLVFLQTLKGSMSGDAEDSNIKVRAFIKFFYPARQCVKEIHAILTETLGEYSPFYVTVITEWPSLNVVNFPPVMCLVLDNPQQ
jgi:hypothetical protein